MRTERKYIVPIAPSDIDDERTAVLADEQLAWLTIFTIAAGARSIDLELSASVVATASPKEKFKIKGVYTGSDWDYGIESQGGDSQVELQITSGGAVQYKSPEYDGYTSGKFQYRAITTSV